MIERFYNVVDEFNPNKNYGTKLRKQYAKCLSVLKKGQRVNPSQFAKEHKNKFTRKQAPKSDKEVVYHSFLIGFGNSVEKKYELLYI